MHVTLVMHHFGYSTYAAIKLLISSIIFFNTAMVAIAHVVVYRFNCYLDESTEEKKKLILLMAIGKPK